MKRAATGLVLLLAAACGGSSGTDRLAVANGAPPTQAPLTSASVEPPHRDPSPAADRTYSPQPVTVATTGTVYASAGSATAGSATAGPGQRSSPAPSPSPRPTPSPIAGTVTVTDGDSGSTVHLAVGQHLRVRLSQGTWDPPVSSADAVLVRRTSTGGYPSDQPVDAVFDAVGAGSADVTAQSDAACFHTEPRCLMASRQWQVHVVVR